MHWFSLFLATGLVVLVAWLGIRGSDPTRWSPLPVFTFLIAAPIDALIPDIFRSIGLWLIAGVYGMCFWCWMLVDSRRDVHQLRVGFIVLLGILCVGNLASLLAETGWPVLPGTPLDEYWPVSVAPPLLLFAYGLAKRHDAGYAKRLIYYALAFAWFGFGNLPYTGELP